jgi:hypothetical protein
MNCANHADASAVAYCRTCGKPLCANCTRPVRGVIYCEDCLGARMEGGAPAASFVPGTVPPAGVVPPSYAVPPVPPVPPRPGVPPGSGPNPTVAGILAGVFPFGVGAVYTGQYAKGLAHLAIFGLLVAGCNVSGSDVLPAICGIGIAFFIVYQIFDAVRSARAIQAGLPPPDPYGLAASFGAGTQGAKSDMSKIPTGAIILIVLGVLFLLHTAGFFAFGFDRFWPLLLMFLGAWLFARNYGLLGEACADPLSRKRRLMGPAVLFTVGTLFLLETIGVASFHRTWPVILLVIGAVKLLQGSDSRWGSGGNFPGAPPTHSGGGFVPPPVVPPPPDVPPPVTPPPASSGDAKASEVNNG